MINMITHVIISYYFILPLYFSPHETIIFEHSNPQIQICVTIFLSPGGTSHPLVIFLIHILKRATR